MATLSPGQAAEWYGKKGYPIFPVHSITPEGCTCGRPECGAPGKHPLIVRWPEKASRVASVIRSWWRKWPEANVGLVTGAVSSLLVLDVDVRHGGHASLEELEGLHGELPATVEAETGSGGRHILFKHPGMRVPNSAGLLGPGLDVRGDGGYIVAPPSVHACGRRYAWDPVRHPTNIELAPLPSWLLVRLVYPEKTLASSKPSGPVRELVLGEVKEGQRNASLARLAGHLLSHRLDPNVILGLLTIWNESKCRPPLSEIELCRTLDSIAGAERQLRRR